MTRTLSRRLVALGLASSLVLAACGNDDDSGTTAGPAGTGDATTTTAGGSGETSPAGLQQATYVTDDFSIEGPEELTAGHVEITQVNEGSEDHHVQIAKLNEGVTYEQLEEALSQPDIVPAMMMVTLVGGPNGAAPGGGESKVIVELDEGQYVLVCVIPSPADGEAHSAKGMHMRLEVAAAEDEATEPALPEVLGTIILRDMEVELPEDFGESGWYEVHNEGAQPHEVVQLALEEGKTAQDFMAWGMTMEGPPPAMGVGGTAIMVPEATMWVYLELEEGVNYLFTCFFPDLTALPEEIPHIAKGMLTVWPEPEA